MIIRTPPILEHLDEVIMRTAQQGKAIQSITMPVWCQQVFVNEVMSLLHVITDAKQFSDLSDWGICEYRGIQILFHDRLTAEIRIKPH